MKLKTKVLIGFITALTITVVIGFISFRSAENTINDNLARRDINNFIKKLKQLSSDFYKYETVESYYVLTVDDKYLTELSLLGPKLTEDLDDLNTRKSKVLTSEELKKTFEQIVEYVNAEILENQENLATFRQRDPVTTRNKFNVQLDDKSVAKVSSSIDELDNRLELIRFAINEKAVTGASTTKTIMAGSSITAVLILIFAFIFVNRDIKKRVEAEKALKELNENLESRIAARTKKLKDSEEHYRSLFENMSEGFAYCRMLYENNEAKDWIYIAVNESFETLTGLKNVTGKRVSEVIPGIRESDPKLFDIYSRVSLTGKPEKFEMFVEALKMWFSISVYSPKKEYFVAVFDVITERKLAEQTLRESEAKLFNAMKIAHLGHWEYDFANELFTYNDNFYSIFRTTAEKAGGYTMSSAVFIERFVHPEDRSAVRSEIRKALESTDPNYSGEQEHRIIYADGETGYIHVRFFTIKDSNGRTIKAYGATQDTTERKIAEEKLHEQQILLQTLIDKSPDLIYIKDEKGRFTMASNSVAKFMGTTTDELIGRTDSDFYPKELAQQYSKDENDIISSGQALINSEEPRVNEDGSKTWILTTKVPLYNKQGEISGILGVSRDITSIKINELKIQNLNRVYAVLCNINQAIVRISDKKELLDEVCRIMVEDGKIRFVWVGFVDEKTKKVLPYSKFGFDNGYLDSADISVEDIPEGRGPVGTCIREEKYCFINDTKRDTRMHIWINAAIERGYNSICAFPLKVNSKVIGAFNIYASEANYLNQDEIKLLEELASDISFALEKIVLEENRRIAEEKLKTTLGEKELLLKEIHHRVKNNLQVVVSLLKMQSEYVHDRADKGYFKASADRVRAMAMIHQQLYRSVNLSEINYDYYLKDLVMTLYKLYCYNSNRIKVSVNANGIKMEIDSAVPCGLLVNEIVTNALKHAFPGDRKGEISIDLQKPGDEYILRIKDNGIGMADAKAEDESKSLGSELIKMLAEQLDANMTINGDKGTEYLIKFKALTYLTRV